MPTGTKGKAKGAIDGARWHELAMEFPLRPLRSDAEAARAVAMVDRLLDLGTRTAEEEDYLTVLTGLVVEWEDQHEPEPEPDPAGMLRYLLDARGVSLKEAAEGSGLSEATLSRILGGRGLPGRKSVAALARYFNADPGVFF
jgi:HTH-type transcriptional regulator/antitoxin HigA